LRFFGHAAVWRDFEDPRVQALVTEKLRRDASIRTTASRSMTGWTSDAASVEAQRRPCRNRSPRLAPATYSVSPHAANSAPGRLDDIGDIDGLPDTVIQVGNIARLSEAIREKPRECETQQNRAGATFGATFLRLRGGEYRVVLTPEQFATLWREAQPIDAISDALSAA